MRRARLTFDQRTLLLALLVGLPASALALVLLLIGDYPAGLRWTLGLALLVAWIGLAHYLRVRVNRPMATVANMLAALREGEFSMRARDEGGGDSMAATLSEVNALERMFREQRLGAVEATNLLRRVLEEIDVVVVAFDATGQVRLANQAAERLTGHVTGALPGKAASELGLEETLEGEAPRTIAREDSTGSRRWQIRRSAIRMEGERLTLVVMTDLSTALRTEEREAWRRLVRVLSHEINNSLAPISSIAASVRDLVEREPRPDWARDAQRGLDIVLTRSDSLRRFMGTYAQLARLPPPVLADVDVEAWIDRVVALESRLPVCVRRGPKVTLRADRDQLEQALINLVANAVDASLQAHARGGVAVGWVRNGGTVEVLVVDQGPGLADTENLFVPFYTTKPHGTGVGLTLSRHIAENHGGSLTLRNRLDRRGAQARLVLPVNVESVL
ncbi:MAG: ATP-binding protein [Gammaproteobacteria bacterium]|nr:ATP-binding protein [Gammaproteobacteria bacterium]